MASDERKARQIMIECERFVPVRVAMTLLAAGAQLTFVRVILLVTRHAARRQLIAVEIFGVAGIAFGRGMAAAQWKFRLVVIEEHGLPEILVVAVLAFGTITAAVNVLNLMTSHAGRRNIGISLAGMARRAIDRSMRSSQREFGGVMIECLNVQPAIVAVALLTLLAELTFVRVKRPVTIKAKTWGVPKLDGLEMTIAAGHRLVRALQAEVRQRVVERLAIKLNNIGASALVVGMAEAAFLLCGIELSAVKSSACLSVRSDLLVAVEALAGLRSP
jgi:hypothetical protein